MDTNNGAKTMSHSMHFSPPAKNHAAAMKSPCGTLRPSYATTDAARVTCRRCLARMAKRAALVASRAIVSVSVTGEANIAAMVASGYTISGRYTDKRGNVRAVAAK